MKNKCFLKENHGEILKKIMTIFTNYTVNTSE